MSGSLQAMRSILRIDWPVMAIRGSSRRHGGPVGQMWVGVPTLQAGTDADGAPW